MGVVKLGNGPGWVSGRVHVEQKRPAMCVCPLSAHGDADCMRLCVCFLLCSIFSAADCMRGREVVHVCGVFVLSM